MRPQIQHNEGSAAYRVGLVAAYKLNDRADTAKVDAEARTLRTFLQTRTETLRSDKAITGA